MFLSEWVYVCVLSVCECVYEGVGMCFRVFMCLVGLYLFMCVYVGVSVF